MDRHDKVAAACERQRARLFPEPGSEPEEPDPDEYGPGNEDYEYDNYRQRMLDEGE